MTTMVRVRGVKRYRDRHGRWRCYHRKSGKALKAEFGTAEFFLELKSIEEGQKARDPSPGTLGLVIKAYRESPAFKDKATATRAGYLRYIDVAKSLHGMALMDIDGPFLAQVRDKISAKRGRRTANYALAMLSILFEFAKERGWAKDNPAKGVKRVKRERDRPRANRPWSLEERQVVLDAAPWQLKVPIALAMFTGLRKTDVIGLTRVVLKSGSIETSKNGEEVFLPVHPDLGLILDMAPKHTAVTIAATSEGTPWTESGFNSSFYKLIGRLEQDGRVGIGLTFHGLRHTVGTLLAEAGASLDDIRRVLGQKTLVMAQHYSDRANKQEATRGMVHRLDPLGRKNEKRPDGV